MGSLVCWWCACCGVWKGDEVGGVAVKLGSYVGCRVCSGLCGEGEVIGESGWGHSPPASSRGREQEERKHRTRAHACTVYMHTKKREKERVCVGVILVVHHGAV